MGIVGGVMFSVFLARQAAWRQAGVQYRCRPVAVKGRAQTGQVVVVSGSLRSGSIGWSSFVGGCIDHAGFWFWVWACWACPWPLLATGFIDV
jgi:hypothetical protein